MAKSISDYFCRETTECLKGWLSIGVLVGHLNQRASLVPGDSLLGFSIDSLGGFCVSMFFFISGYGLMASYSRNRGGYLANFQRNRVLSIFAINAFLVFLYSLQRFLLYGSGVSLTEIAMSLFYGGCIVPFGWYLLCIMVLYELFYLGAKFGGRHVCWVVLLLTMLYMVLARGIDMPSYWYSSCLAFPCGVFFRQYKSRIDNLSHQRQVIFFFLGLILFAGSVVFLHVIGGEDSSLAKVAIFRFLRYPALMIHGIFFVIMVVGGLMLGGSQAHAASVITKRLSAIYLEIYVMQGLAMAVLRNPRWRLDNDCLFAVCSVVLTLALAAAIRPLFQKIISWVKVY